MRGAPPCGLGSGILRSPPSRCRQGPRLLHLTSACPFFGCRSHHLLLLFLLVVLLPSPAVHFSTSKSQLSTMSKLSPTLKALVNAPFARPGPVPAPRQVEQFFSGIAKDAASRNISPRSWLAISVSLQFSSCFPLREAPAHH